MNQRRKNNGNNNRVYNMGAIANNICTNSYVHSESIMGMRDEILQLLNDNEWHCAT